MHLGTSLSDSDPSKVGHMLCSLGALNSAKTSSDFAYLLPS